MCQVAESACAGQALLDVFSARGLTTCLCSKEGSKDARAEPLTKGDQAVLGSRRHLLHTQLSE